MSRSGTKNIKNQMKDWESGSGRKRSSYDDFDDDFDYDDFMDKKRRKR